MNNQQSDTYVLLTVLFASALFLAGTSRQFKDSSAQRVLIVTAFCVMVVGFLMLLSQPIEFSRDDLPI